MATLNITLAKALKVKNRLAGRLAKIMADIQTYNSVVLGSDTVDVRQLYEQYAAARLALIQLKTALTRANHPIVQQLYELAEMKSTAKWLAALNTRHGPQVVYHATPVTYTATLHKTDVDEEVRRLESQIDARQDDIDQFNHANTISVDEGVLELAK